MKNIGWIYMLDFKTIGDSLTTDEFNQFVTLIRNNFPIIRRFTLTENIINDEYFTLEFDLSNATIVSNGVLVTARTREHPPKVELRDVLFEHSSHTLVLKVFNFTGDRSADDYATVTVALEEDVETAIPLTGLENGEVILFDGAELRITHDKPTIKVIDDEQS